MTVHTKSKKALIVASVASMLDQFNRSNIEILQEEGFEVHVAANFVSGSTTSNERIQRFSEELSQAGVRTHHISFERTVWKLTNIRSYRSLRNLIETHRFGLIHCHSPIGGVLSRIAARKARVPVIYTAHGFHFFRGSSVVNWLFYYPIERWLSRCTNILITINKEDAGRAAHFPCAVEFVPGVGVDCERFRPGSSQERNAKRRELSVSEDHFLIVCAAELSARKNQQLLLRAIPEIVSEHPSFLLLLVGEGPKRVEYERLVDDLRIGPFVRFLGYREEVHALYRAADAAALVSLQEGLPMVVMESMASGLPVVATDCRGNVDLIADGLRGFLVPTKAEPAALAEKILGLVRNPELGRQVGLNSVIEIRTKYSQEIVAEKMRKIYAYVGAIRLN